MLSSDDAVGILLDLPRYAGTAGEGFKPGLERMEELLGAMGRPHEGLRAIHVAGTNGKGSVASMTAAVAAAAGLRTGLHTSPHLHHVTERMRVDGTPAPEEWLAEAVETYRDAFERIAPSFFEATIALCLRYFAEEDVDVAVVEVGLGGRLDATNVLDPALAIITSVDLDHTDLLGDTLEAIAREKAGIVKPGTPVLTGVTQGEALGVIREVAEERGAPLHRLDAEVDWRVREHALTGSVLDVDTPARRYDRLRVALPGRHQQRNALLAVRAAELALSTVGPDAVANGLAEVRRRTGLRGRLEVVQQQPLVVVDVAHNPSSVAATLDTVAPAVAERGGRLRVGLCLSADKDLPAIARLLAARDALVTPVPVATDRALRPDRIAEALRAAGAAVTDPVPARELVEAFRREARPEDGLLAVGSHVMASTLLG
jgi:dihydrofolate synthase/folylpolyglutamate synthase